MLKNPALNDLGRRLLVQGMPVAEVRRFLTELRQHHTDLIEEQIAGGMSAADASAAADRRLGEPRQLADVALRQFRRTTLLGRHAWFFFGVCPLFCLLLTWLVVGGIVGCSEHWLLRSSVAVNHVTKLCTPALCIALNFAVPFLLATCFYRAARRRALAAFWRLFPAGLILLLAIFAEFSVWFSKVAPNSGRLQLGVGRPHFGGLLPLAAALALGVCMRLRRSARPGIFS
jgi:hypothetical protein